jgi:preprotein translocase subunit SecD
MLVASALAVSTGSSGCKKQPALRLTYEVDVASAYDRAMGVGQIMDTSRKVVAQRIGPGGSIATHGQLLTIDLASLQADELRALKQVLAPSGRLSFQSVDDAASAGLFGSINDAPDDQGITVETETVPDGLDASGARRSSRSSFARMTCRPPKYPNEAPDACLVRFRMWIGSLHPPGGRVVSVQAVRPCIPGTDPPRLEHCWRTLVLNERADLTQDDVTDAAIGQNTEAGNGYYVALTFSPSGAARFEALTGANVNRRFAIVIDDIIDSAPVIRTKIGGGRATVTMGSGDPEQQLLDARKLRLVLLSGALPAPLRLVSEESLRAGGR